MTEIEVLTVLYKYGFKVETVRFPHSYCYDYIRTKRDDGMSRDEVAQIIHHSFKDKTKRYNVSCYVAILYLISQQPNKVSVEVVELMKKLREDVLDRLNEIMYSNY